MTRLIISVFCIYFFSITGVYAQGNSSGANGQPFDALQQQINALQTQVDNLTALIALEPVEIYVDCLAGDTVSNALASVGGTPNSLIITIGGTCNETVFILRSNVMLVGESPSDGIRTIFASRGASHIELESITLGGGSTGLACLNGASVTARNVNILNSSTGVLALYGGNCDISDSTIDSNGTGLTVGVNSQVWLRGVDVSNSSNMGANVYTSSSISLERSPTDSSPTTFSNNFRGLQIFSDGSARIAQAIIENNRGEGLYVTSGSSVHFESSGNVEIRGNLRHGIAIGNLSTTILSSGLNISNNGYFGLECFGTHSVSSSNPPAYSGNGFGAISPNCDINP